VESLPQLPVRGLQYWYSQQDSQVIVFIIVGEIGKMSVFARCFGEKAFVQSSLVFLHASQTHEK
jgi:hypothetical protein